MALSLLLCLPFFIFCLFLRLSLIILHFSPPSCLSVRLGAVFNMLRGHMSTPNATEQIRYFVCIHSSFGPIRVLAFCYCHAWWGFLRFPTKGEKHVPGAVSWGSHLASILLDFLQVYPVYVERGLRKNGDTVITFAPYFKDGGRKFWRVNLQSESGKKRSREVSGWRSDIKVNCVASHPHLDLQLCLLSCASTIKTVTCSRVHRVSL